MENENKYIFLEDFINSKYEDFNDKLKSYGYYAVDGNSFSVTYEHETNKSEICIFMTTEDEIYVDFHNAKRDVYSVSTKFFTSIGCGWYLGTKDNFDIDDIFEILNNEEFKKFVLTDKNITLKQYILNTRKDFFDVLKNNYGYSFIVGDDNCIDFVHKSTNMILSIRRDLKNLTISFNIKDFIWSSKYLYDSDFIITDINTILCELETEGYKNFKKDVEDRKNEYKNTKAKPKNLFNKFCNMLLPSDFSKYCANNELNLVLNERYYFTLKGHGYSYQVSMYDEEYWFYVYNKNGDNKISRKIATVYDIDKKIGDFSSYFTDVITHIINKTFEDSIAKFQDSIFNNIRIHKGSDDWKIKSLDVFLKQNNQEQQSQTQKQIENICKAISDVLIDKNKKYGNSALKPINVFYKGNNTNSILIRLDDKLSRIKNNTEDIRVNDICDTIGYLVLLLVAKGVKIEDIEKLKD